MPRFAILRHDCPPGYERELHWDFMLEFGETLKTWALPQAPGEAAGGESSSADELPDHRLAYLTYEGPVSGGRGCVTRCDRGEYRLIRRSNDEWVVELDGERLQGVAALRRLTTAPPRWQWEFARRQRIDEEERR